jgi:hypothetical protein
MTIFPDPKSPIPTLGETGLTRATASVFARDQTLMREFAGLFAFDPLTGNLTDSDLVSAIDSSTRVVLTEQVGLAVGETSQRRPDLSVAGLVDDQPAFQILVEAKVHASFHRITVAGRDLLQPAAYVTGWRLLDDEGEAPVRRVGCLLRTPVGWRDELEPDTGSEVRPTDADRSWLDIIVLLWEAISARLSPDDGGAVKNVAATVVMAWLVEEIHAIAVRKRDRRVNPAKPGDWVAGLLRLKAEQAEIQERRETLNRGRPDDQKLKSLSPEGFALLENLLPRRIRFTAM